MSRAHSRCSSDTPQSAPPPHPAILCFPRVPQAPLWLMSAGQRPQRPDPLLGADCRPQHVGLGVTWPGWVGTLPVALACGKPGIPRSCQNLGPFTIKWGEHLLWDGPRGQATPGRASGLTHPRMSMGSSSLRQRPPLPAGSSASFTWSSRALGAAQPPAERLMGCLRSSSSWP